MIEREASRLNLSIQQEGYAIVPFPKFIAAELKRYVLEYTSMLDFVNCASPTNFPTISAQISHADDARFYSSMQHAFRYFPPQFANLLVDWVTENFCDVFDAAQIGTHPISPIHLQQNPNLEAHSPSFYFRFVRPNKSDIAYAHVDKHYWELSQANEHATFPSFSFTDRWKLWIPLLGCNSDNMLQIVPGSHKYEVPFDLEFIAGESKPSIRSSWLAANGDKFMCPLKQTHDTALLMHDTLVHRGPKNPGPLARVSAELTIFTSRR
jgi:hypothetical protein